MSTAPIVLAFSGGLDTSAIMIWLKETYRCPVIAYCAVLGNGDDPESIASRAYELGADKFIADDLREEFVTDYLWPMLQAGATYQHDYLLGTAIARPLIAKKLAELALKEGAFAIAHGATGKGNDQIRFEKVWSQLAPNVEIIAPWKTWSFKGRDDLLKYVADKGFPITSANKVYSIDENIFHVSYEGGTIEDLEVDAFALLGIKPHLKEPTELKLAFEAGTLASASFAGKSLDAKASPVAALESLNELGQAYAVGVVDLVEERVNGIKSRGIYLTPGGSLIHSALQQLKAVCWDKQALALSQTLAQTFGEGVYEGDWFRPQMVALKQYFASLGALLNGEITMTLLPYTVLPKGRVVKAGLYDQEMVSFNSDAYGLNEASNGFCKTLNFQFSRLGKQSATLAGES